jgi:hypothetical protein
MTNSQLRECMTPLAETYQLRWSVAGKCYLGIHRGILVKLSEFDGVLSFLFSTPNTIDLRPQILENFADFTHCAKGGLPPSWIKIATEATGSEERNSPDTCYVELDSGRLEQIGPETYLQLPELVANDFQALGAEDHCVCATCGQENASVLTLVDYAAVPLCEECWQDLDSQTLNHALPNIEPVRWLFVVPSLCMLTLVGGWIWGFIQQPKLLEKLPVGVIFLLPILWACFLIFVILSLGRGVNLLLRIALSVSVLLSVLMGNVWGFRSHLVQLVQAGAKQPVEPPSWFEATLIYFESLPWSWKGEVPFFVGGLVGAWLGHQLYKNREKIQVW